jgi:hypothetical protein
MPIISSSNPRLLVQRTSHATANLDRYVGTVRDRPEAGAELFTKLASSLFPQRSEAGTDTEIDVEATRHFGRRRGDDPIKCASVDSKVS